MPNIIDDNANSNNKADISNPNPSVNNFAESGSNTETEQDAHQAPANALSTPDFDASEITRKLDGIIETQSILTKAIYQLMQGGTKSPFSSEPTTSTRPNDTSSNNAIKTIDQLNL